MKLVLLVINAGIIINYVSQQTCPEFPDGGNIPYHLQSSDSTTLYDIIGIWYLSIKTPRGKKNNQLTISMKDEEYIGQTDNGSFSIARNGNDLSWTSTIKSPMGKMPAEFTMTVEGSDMTGTIQASGRTLDVVGKKK